MKPYILRRRRLGYTSVKGICEKSEQGIDWCRNDRGIPEDASVIFRWGCTANVPNGVKVYNKASAIHKVTDKVGFRMEMNEDELCPKTWMNSSIITGEVNPTYPAIVRPAHHSQGKDVFFVNNYEEWTEAYAMSGGATGYTSEYIPKKQEFRVYIVQGRVVAVAEKIPENREAIAWNHNGEANATFHNVKWGQWNLEVVDIAVQAFNLSGLDFGGVDVILSEDDEPYVLEINSAPSLTTNYRQQCFAKTFDWMLTESDEKIPVVSGEEWKGLIHPAITDKARII